MSITLGVVKAKRSTENNHMSDFAEIKINMSDRKGVMCYAVLSK